ncbi:restriction endonuclease [Dorea sp. D27]|uniref:restriction endonuclease n=1 Tax=Dorea sp. D27 TaxID=658665 RepID=UPI0006732148|nr:restriction endonuclease [Dorea sp. D27]KMZ55703.1 restriction endonuclease superfamily [Dorea sp. D27]
MSSVFISYSYADILARNIVEGLKKSTIENLAILTTYQGIGGNNPETQLFDAIRKCDYFVCIFDNYSPNVMLELGYALGRNKNIILVGDYNEIPFDLRNFDYIKRNENISDVLMELNKRIYSSEILPKEVICYKDYKENILHALNEQEFLDGLSYRDFEELIYEYLKAQNLPVNYQPLTRDRGYHFLLPTMNCIIEIKKYSKNNKISLSVIRALLGTMVENNMSKGIIISSSGFTQSAINFVQNLKQKIVLLSLDDLLKIDGNFVSFIMREYENQPF